MKWVGWVGLSGEVQWVGLVDVCGLGWVGWIG